MAAFLSRRALRVEEAPHALNLSQFVGRNLMLALSVLVLESISRYFLPMFPLDERFALPLLGVILSFVILLRFLMGEHLSIPRPSRSDAGPLIACAIVAFTFVFYFTKAPFLPDFPSVDLKDHLNAIQNCAKGCLPAPSSVILYYAVRWVLASIVAVIPLPALLTVRYSMAALCILSPLVFYDFTLSLFGNRDAAWLTSLVYAASGLWFTMVFNVGLLPNFYALLSSLFLVSAVMGFVRGGNKFGPMLLMLLALVNAGFSHYTILFLVVPLAPFAVILGWKGAKLKGLLAGILLLAPVGLGLIFFNSLLSVLFGFLSGPGIPFADTSLGSILSVSILKYLVDDLGNDWFSILLLFPSLITFAWLTLKKRDLRMSFVLGCFAFIVFTSPQNFAAWRFAFPAFPFLFVMVGFVLSLLLKGKFYSATQPRVIGLLFLMVFPLFLPGWGGVVLNTTLIAPQQFYAQQAADYNALMWLKANGDGRGGVTPADLSLEYSQTLGGPPVSSACESGIAGFYDPNQMSFFAIKKGAHYIILTSGLDCQPPTVTIVNGNGIRQNITETPMSVITSQTLGCPVDCLVYSQLPYIEIFKVNTG